MCFSTTSLIVRYLFDIGSCTLPRASFVWIFMNMSKILSVSILFTYTIIKLDRLDQTYVQLNPAIAALKRLTNFNHCKWISIIANIEIEI